MTGSQRAPYVQVLDPREYLEGKRRIVVDTSVLLESREGYRGGVPQLVMNCAEALVNNPLVIPRAVLNELTSQTSVRRARRDPELAERAKLAKALVNDLVRDRLATTDFGGIKDYDADPEFSTIAKVASGVGWEVLFLTADITVKLEVRLIGRITNTAHLAGVPTVDGLIEVESPSLLRSKGRGKLSGLSDKSGKADEYDRLSTALREWSEAYRPEAQPKKSAQPRKTQNRRSQPPAEPFAISNTVKPLDQVLAVTRFPGDGDEVHFKRPDTEGQLVLGERISRGKEGSVYAVEGEPHLVAKIFKKGKVTTHRKEKVELMVQHKVWLPGVCFPESILTYEGEFVGFTMQRAQDAIVLNDTIFIPQELERLYPGWTRRDLVDVCLSFLERVKSLHEVNIIIGDINPNNVMLGNGKEAWIIDIDSVQVNGYPCPVGWDEFTAPEILGGVQGLRSIEHEQFAIAVMLFMIMMTGTFPYENSGSDDTIQIIKSGLFPYGFDGRSERGLQPPLRWLCVWSHLSRDLKRLFWNSFHRDGSRYQPANRVTVEEWIGAFEDFKEILSYPDVDPQSLEIFPIRRKADRGAQLLDCPHCGGRKFIAQYSVGKDPDKVFRTPSACYKCLPKCESCGEPWWEPQMLQDGICWRCRTPGSEAAERQKRGEDRGRRESQKAKRDVERARRETLDPTRLCARCGNPFITYGNVEWHVQTNRSIPTTHKTGECRTGPAAQAAAGPPQSPRLPDASKTWGQRIARWWKNLWSDRDQ